MLLKKRAIKRKSKREIMKRRMRRYQREKILGRIVEDSKPTIIILYER